MRMLRLLALVMGLVVPAAAGPYFTSPIISTGTGTAWEDLSGWFTFYASTLTKTTPMILLDGTTGSVTASSATLKYGVTAATGSFTATGVNYSVMTSSGISVPGTAGVYAGFFSGNGSALTNVNAASYSGNVNASQVNAGNFQNNPYGFPSNVTIGSTLTVVGSAFSVGGSTFVVTGSSVGIGTTSPQATLDVTSGTILSSATFSSYASSAPVMFASGNGNAQPAYSDGNNAGHGFGFTGSGAQSPSIIVSHSTMFVCTTSGCGSANSWKPYEQLSGVGSLKTPGWSFLADTGSGFTDYASTPGAIAIVSSGSVVLQISPPQTSTMTAYAAFTVSSMTIYTNTDITGSIGSTVTITGNAVTIGQNSFSVGGSSFAVNGGTTTAALLQVSSGVTIGNINNGLNLPTGGFVKFGDGTVQTTASSGGGGASLTSTNTWTASQTVVGSSLTVGVTVYTSTISHSGIYVNGWSIVASSNPNLSGGVTFTGIEPGKQYRLTCSLNTSGSATFQLSFRSDATAHYYNGECGAATVLNYNGANTGYIQLGYDNTGGRYGVFDVYFEEVNGGGTEQVWGSSSLSIGTSPYTEPCMIHGIVATNGAAEVNIYPSVGTITGTCELWQAGTPNR